MNKTVPKILSILGGLTLITSTLFAQPASVLVVYSQPSIESKSVADYYLAKRNIPATNLCPIPISGDTIDYPTYHTSVKTPILACLNALGKGSINYIVFTYQTPYIIYDGSHFPDFGAARSIDSLMAIPETLNDTVYTFNPYAAFDHSSTAGYADFIPFGQWKAAHPTQPLYIVSRLDGTTPAIAKSQIDKAILAETQGVSGMGCFDARYNVGLTELADAGYGAGDWDILRAWQFWSTAGLPATLDRNEAEFGTAPAPSTCGPAVMYWGWYQGFNASAVSWSPGAIGVHLDSLSALNIKAENNFVGQAISHGITFATGAVSEPNLQGLPNGDTLVRSLFQKATVGEAMFRATQEINWMLVSVGDPLYRPFPQGKPTIISQTITLPAPVITPPPGITPSPDGTHVPPSPSITDTRGDIWTFRGTAIYVNDKQAGNGAGSILSWCSGRIYAKGTDNNWWSASGIPPSIGWGIVPADPCTAIASPPPPPPPPPPSPDNTAVVKMITDLIAQLMTLLAQIKP